MPMKELPITTSFFPSLAAGETVSVHHKTESSLRNITCINLGRIIDAPESKNILKVDTGDGELLGLASGSKDELVIVNELFASFQHDLLSENVDGGDSLVTHRLSMTSRGDLEISHTVEVRKVTPSLILRSAAVLHSIFEASVMSALLSFVL